MLPSEIRSSGDLWAGWDGSDEVSLPRGAVLIFSHPIVKDDFGNPRKLYVHSGANSIKWSYNLNTQTTPTIGGEVTQVLSCNVGPMTISGQASGLRTDIEGSPNSRQVGFSDDIANRQNANNELKSIMDWFLEYMHAAGQSVNGQRLRDERAILFQYPERQWDFYIQVTALNGFTYDKDVYAPEWSITAEVLDDNALNFFRGVTMHSFTDNLTSKSILKKMGTATGFVGFEGGRTDRNSQGAFGKDGKSGNPFLNPDISPSAAVLAQTMGNNFQALVAAWSGGGFSDFGFNALLDSGIKPELVNSTYINLFGGTFLGNLPGYTGVGSGVGSVTYNVNTVNNVPTWVLNVLEAGGWATTNENKAFLAGWGRTEGSETPGHKTTFNWLGLTQIETGSTTGDFLQKNIRTYPDFETGVKATVDIINNGLYPSIVAALKSGDPYNPQFADGLLVDLSLWSNHANDPKGGKEYFDTVMTMNATTVKVKQAPTGTGGMRRTVINWAYQYIAYWAASGVTNNYDQKCSRTIEGIVPGDFSKIRTSDCSNSVALMYYWGAAGARAYATNNGTYNNSTTATMWQSFASDEVPLDQLKAGDLIIYGTGPAQGQSDHVSMLLENWRGQDTLLFSHGSNIPHTVTYGVETAYQTKPPHGFSVLP